MALDLLALLLLVFANAFFVAAEFSVLRAGRSRIAEMVERGDRLARQAHIAQSNLARTISGAQLGITLASLGLGWLGEPLLARSIQSAFSGLPEPTDAIATHGIAVALAFTALVILHIVFGQLAPKFLAFVKAETVIRIVAGPLNLFNFVMRPFSWLLDRAAGLVLSGFGIDLAGLKDRVHGPADIQLLLRHSTSEGTVEDDEEAMIKGVFELTNTVAREVMTPRPDIIAFGSDAALKDVLKAAAESGHSRFPVYGESMDDILGVVLVKDLIRWMQAPEKSPFDLREVMREPYFVPDTKAVDDLLAELRHHKVHLAIVLDEFGGTDGIVTLEDVLEEIVGEIFDEHDVSEPDVRIGPDGRILIDGGADFTDVVQEFGLAPDTQESDYDTVAGFVMGSLGRIPEAGDRVVVGKGELEVLETSEKRVTRLELLLTPGDDQESLTGGVAVDDL